MGLLGVLKGDARSVDASSHDAQAVKYTVLMVAVGKVFAERT